MVIGAVVLVGVLFLLQIKLSKSIISPDSINMYWMGTICFGTVILCRQYEYNVPAILWLTASMVLFTGFSYLGGKIKLPFPKNTRLSISILENRKWLFWVIYSCVLVAGLSYSIQMLHNNGFSIMKLTNINYLYEVNVYFRNGRYAGNVEIKYTVIQQICLCFAYGGALASGYFFKLYKGKNWQKYIFLVGVIPNLAITVLDNTKTGTVFAFCLFAAGYFIACLEADGSAFALTKKKLLLIAGVFVAFIAFMFFSLKLRYHTVTEQIGTLRLIEEIFFDYLGSSIVNFSNNFGKMLQGDGKFDLLPVSTLSTANSTWIIKYKWWGALAIYAVRGIGSGVCLDRLINRQCGAIGKCFLACMYVNALYSFCSPAFAQQTVLIGTVLVFPVFVILYDSIWNENETKA